jgi:competence protein ComEC
MLAVAASASVARLPLSASRVLPLAAAVVCALDPWAAQAPGFWLSFGAVAMLVLGSAGRWRRDPSSQDKSWLSRLLDTLRSGAHAQALLTIGLLPLLALLFQQISLVSPLANAVAIPLVSLAVTPLALAATLLCLVPGMSGAAVIAGQWAHGLFAGMMRLLQPLADAPQASLDLAAPPWPWVALALFGVVWAMQPRGLPGRAWALTLLLPLLLYRPARPDTGDWRMTLLDVGQGSAAVIETAHGAVLYDTGPRLGPEADAGERIIAPFLRARGIGRLDHLVVSHADMDHAGGLGSLLQALPVNTLHASYDVPGAVPAWPKATAFSRCAAGQSWVQDGVEFAFLHPAIATRNDPRAGDRNETSCVLRVSGRHHRALLPGDIGAKEEAMLDADDVTVDVVALPHHGSRFSSSTGFVGAVHAAHAVAQAGYRNRYGHPSPEVLRRWEAAGSLVHRSDRDGALTFVSRPRGLIVRREREVQRRYWRRP